MCGQGGKAVGMAMPGVVVGIGYMLHNTYSSQVCSGITEACRQWEVVVVEAGVGGCSALHVCRFPAFLTYC